MKLFDRVLNVVADRICERLERFVADALAEALTKPKQPTQPPPQPPMRVTKPRAVWVGDETVSVQWDGSKY
jgi:hypothetical protein